MKRIEELKQTIDGMNLSDSDIDLMISMLKDMRKDRVFDMGSLPRSYCEEVLDQHLNDEDWEDLRHRMDKTLFSYNEFQMENENLISTCWEIVEELKEVN